MARSLLLILLALLLQPAWASPAPAVITKGLGFPEGTVFVRGTLYFVDYGASTIYRLEGHQAVPVWTQEGCGANGLLPYRDRLLVACYDNGTVQEVTLDGKHVRTIESTAAGERFDRPNDLAADGKGGAYFTASGGDGGTPGKIFYLSPTAALPSEVASSLENANGIALSPDGRTLYLGESAKDRILQYEVAPDGALTHRATFIDLDAAPLPSAPRHTPDGIRTDAAGRVFVSLYNGGGFAVLDPRAKLLSYVALPAAHHSNLALSSDEKFVYGTMVDDDLMGGPSGALYRIVNPVSPAGRPE
jgi:gluconolactonase